MLFNKEIIMAVLSASSWTVTINKTRQFGGRRQTDVTLAYGDGADTYPTAGIPMPTVAQLGMKDHIDSVIIVSASLDAATTTSYQYQYDKTNHTMQIFCDEDPVAVNLAAFPEMVNTGAPAASTLEVTVTGW